MTTRREQLAAIRREAGWRAAADLVGIPRRERVSKPSNPSGFGYRTLSDKNRRDRLQRIITGSTRTGRPRSVVPLKEKQEKAISAALSEKAYPNANARLAIDTANRERRALAARAAKMKLRPAQQRAIARRTQPLTKAQEQTLIDKANAGDWEGFRAEYDSVISVARSVTA